MNRKLAIGCGVALLLFIIGVVALVVVIPKLIHKGLDVVKNAMAEEQRLSAFENAWSPPSASPDASWFPEKVGMWRLVTQGASTGVARLQIERVGRYGKYQLGADVVEVNVMAANDDEKHELFSRAQPDRSQGGTIVSTSSGNRSSIRVNGDDYTRCWWMPKGWFFIFHSHGGSDPKDFMEPYLKAIDAARVAAALSTEPAPALK